VPGKGQIKTTGKLGEVMTESIQAAFSYREGARAGYGIKPSDLQPQGCAHPLARRRGAQGRPSAGIGMVTAIVSTLTGVAVHRDVAMTGEVTLRGRVLPIGGLKEKLLAALRGGIKTVLIPQENEKDLAEIPANIKEGLEIIPGHPCRSSAGACAGCAARSGRVDRSGRTGTDYLSIRRKARFFADISFDRGRFLLLIPGPAQPRFLPGIGP
jgi:ATP-dependent Lon protease